MPGTVWTALDTVTQFDNLEMVCNARVDTALYGLPPAKTGKKGRINRKKNWLICQSARNRLDSFGYRNIIPGRVIIGVCFECIVKRVKPQWLQLS